MRCLERALNLMSTMVMTLGLGACVSLSEDGGMAPVQDIAYAEPKAEVVKVSTEAWQPPGSACREVEGGGLEGHDQASTSPLRIA